MKNGNLSIILMMLLVIIIASCSKKETTPPPVAGFTCDNTTGNAPLTVNFTSTSTGDITSYSWNFADGSTSTLKNPTHTYTNPGSYTVVLEVSGTGGSASCNKTITVIVAAPVASFTCDNTTGNMPLTVNFTSTSTGSITSYSWTFGDGNTTNIQNPSHTYNNVSTYTAQLTITGPGGTSSSNKTIVVTPALVSSFTCDKTSGSAPLTVNFTSTSTGNITSYSWTFGDGGTSTSQNPSHTYNNAGTYTATLIVTGPSGSNSSSKNISVTPAAPVSSFTCSTTYGNAPLVVNFTSTSTGNITSYSWNFGDGGTSNAQNPSYIYYSSGTYTASLTVNGPGGTSTSSKTIIVTSGTNTTDVTFTNPVFTDIHVTFNGYTQVISPGGSVTFYSVTGTYLEMTAYTSGTTTTGSQIGELLSWDSWLTLTGGSESFELDVLSNTFFIYMQNSGTHDLINLYVNYGLTDQSYDNILVPPDGVEYNIGYYPAHSNTEVRMYYQDQPTSYTYWDQGTHFTLPWTDNQSAYLLNMTKSESFHGEAKLNALTSSNSPTTNMIPAKTIYYQKDPKAKKLYCK